MVDGIVLLVDAAEGPLPQTRFVLRKALAHDMPVILVINKVDRPDARIAEVVDEVYELFMDLDAKEHQLDFPIVYCSGRDGWASLDLDERSGTSPAPSRSDVARSRRDPARPHPGAHVPRGRTAAGLGDQPRRLAVPRSPGAAARHGGHDREGPAGRLVPRDGTIARGKVAELFLTEHLTRVPVDCAGPGDLVAVAGIAEITSARPSPTPRTPSRCR